jgi:pseudaminic acid cytidylyltransferase
MSRRLAIIPARGGSKRIPRKNIKDFFGKPIIAYSINTALQSNLFSDVIVSTDDPEIAEIAKFHGASVPFLRSEQNANDFATTLDVIHEVISCYQKKGVVFQTICCIYPTAPFVKQEHLQEGLTLLEKNNYDVVLPTVPFGYPIWRSLRKISRKDKPDSLEMIWPEYLNSRSQDLEDTYHDAGQWYWLKYGSELNSLFENSGTIVLPETVVQDIDNEIDWKLAELKYKLLYASGTD